MRLLGVRVLAYATRMTESRRERVTWSGDSYAFQIWAALLRYAGFIHIIRMRLMPRFACDLRLARTRRKTYAAVPTYQDFVVL